MQKQLKKTLFIKQSFFDRGFSQFFISNFKLMYFYFDKKKEAPKLLPKGAKKLYLDLNTMHLKTRFGGY